jgi:hypothetical protein
MNKQEQINALQFRIERIEAKLAEQHISNNFRKLNHSEKPNSCEPDYTHLLPEGYEFCAEQDAEKWVKVEIILSVPESEQMQVGYVWHNPIRPFVNRYRPIRPIPLKESVMAEPDYTHLLPEGYEFCTEQDAEKWVKVEIILSVPESEQMQVGYIWDSPTIPSTKRYRPIRPIQYHIAVHESVTAEPDPYQVDWSNAPEGTVAHYYNNWGHTGRWIIFGLNVFITENSYQTLPSDLDWKKSLRLNPKLK